MKSLFSLFLGCLLSAGVYAQAAKRDEKFILTGKIIGRDTGLVMFWYFNERNEVVKDTLKLTKGVFEISGTINRACEAILWTDLNIKMYDDPSEVQFLLTAGKISIIYDIRHPLSPKILGSELQVEKDRWDKKKGQLLALKSAVRKSIQDLEAHSRSDSNPEAGNSMDRLSIRYDSINVKIKYLDVNYILAHRNSYLSAFLLSQQKRRLSVDSIEKLYSSLTYDVKMSSLAHDVLLYVYPLTDDNQFRKNNRMINANLEQRLGNLKTVYDLSLSDTSGKLVGLSSFAGRYLVIDFWASWCKPCLVNVPYLNELIKRYETDSLYFISISLDKDLAKWKNFLIANMLNGVQLLDSNGFNGLAAIYCKAIWVPHYVIADKDGRIINYDAPQANEKGLRDILDGLVHVNNARRN